MVETVEWVLIFIAIASLWPWLLGYRSAWYQGWLIIVLALMALVAANRLRRIGQGGEHKK